MASLLLLLRREEEGDSPKRNEESESGTSTAMCSPRSRAPRKRRQPRRRAERPGTSQQPAAASGVPSKEKPKRKSKDLLPSQHIAYRFKTELCKNFQAGEHCAFADRCCFAHGEAELRAVPEYSEPEETESCPDFYAGFCRQGANCPLSHKKSPKRYTVILELLEQSLLLQATQGKSLESAAPEDTPTPFYPLNDNVLPDDWASWSHLLIHKRI